MGLSKCTQGGFILWVNVQIRPAGRARWRIDVQHDGQRKSFYSSKPGRTGQREANAKADAWLDDGINPRGEHVAALYPRWFCHDAGDDQRGQLPQYCKPLENLDSAADRQQAHYLIDRTGRAGGRKQSLFGGQKQKKTLKSLCADMRAFFKYCRLCKLSTFNPEALHIPAGARYKGKQVLQPADLVKLFSTDTTTYRGQTMPDEYINAYRFQVLTGLRPGEVSGLTGQTSPATPSTSADQSISRANRRAARTKTRCGPSLCPHWPGGCWTISGISPAASAVCFALPASHTITAAGKPTAPPTA